MTEEKKGIDIVQIRQRVSDLLTTKFEEKPRREVMRFLDSYRHKSKTSHVDHFTWTAEALEIVSTVPNRLSEKEKAELVTAMYQDLSEDDTNGFAADFDVGGAIEFIFDVKQQKYGITVRRKGFLSGVLCCQTASVVADIDDKTLNVNVGL